MENTSNTKQKTLDRSKNNSDNAYIYDYLKEEDFSQLTNEEFVILQTKFKPFSLHGENGNFYDFYYGPNAKGIKGDEKTLNIYKRVIAAHLDYFPCVYKYSRVFSFCRELGITNLYDIGCGQQLQAFLLINTPDINYTGIDSNIFHNYPDEFIAEPEYINEMFEKFTGSSRIKYIKEIYPIDLAVIENNIAIVLYCFFGIETNKEKWKNAVAILSRDFERVLFNIPIREYNLRGMNIKDIIYNEVEVWKNPFEKYYDLWKKSMPDFEFYRIGEPNLIFGTKFFEDRKKLEKKYILIDDQVLTGVVDIPWHMTLLS